MAFNPDTLEDRNKLAAIMVHHRKRLEAFRRSRSTTLQQYVGYRHGEYAASLSVAVNLIARYLDTFVPLLAPTSPAAMVTVSTSDLLDTRNNLELGTNALTKAVDLEETVRDSVFDALLVMAVVKVGRRTDRNVSPLPGFRQQYGQPFVKHVLLDDWVHDTAAQSIESMEFAADRCRISKAELERSGAFTHEEIAELPVVSRQADREGQTQGSQYGETVGEYVDLWQVCYRRELIFTLAGDDQGPTSQLVGEVSGWDGSRASSSSYGPFRLLRFRPIPGRIMPVAPIAGLIELHELGNALFRKASDQAKNAKMVFGARRAHYSDVRKLMDSVDRGVVTTDGDPGMIKEFMFPGPDAGVMGAYGLVQSLFSEQAGNLDLLSGLGPQSETARQDQLLFNSANRRVAAMQDRLTRFLGDIIGDLAWMLWSDPLFELPLPYRVAGIEQPVDVLFTADDLKGRFFDYNITVNPYSMRPMTPQDELATLSMILTQFYLPLAEQAQAQGIVLNLPGLFRRLSQLTNMRTLDEILSYAGKALAPTQGAMGRPPPQQRIPGGNGRDMGSMQQLSSLLNAVNQRAA